MAVYTIRIDDGRLTLDANVSFDLNATKVSSGSGKIEHIDIFITAYGDIVDEATQDPAVIMSDLQELTDEVIEKFLPVRIELLRDAVVEYDFLPSGNLEKTYQKAWSTSSKSKAWDTRPSIHRWLNVA